MDELILVKGAMSIRVTYSDEDKLNILIATTNKNKPITEKRLATLLLQHPNIGKLIDNWSPYINQPLTGEQLGKLKRWVAICQKTYSKALQREDAKRPSKHRLDSMTRWTGGSFGTPKVNTHF